MEENEEIILKNSKLEIHHIGKQLNIFSIFATLSIIITVVGGLALIHFSEQLDEATQYYLDNIIGLLGSATILFAATIIPIVVIARRLVHTAKHIFINNDMTGAPAFLRQTKHLWHYITTLLIILIALGAVAVIAGYVFFSTNLGVF